VLGAATLALVLTFGCPLPAILGADPMPAVVDGVERREEAAPAGATRMVSYFRSLSDWAVVTLSPPHDDLAGWMAAYDAAVAPLEARHRLTLRGVVSVAGMGPMVDALP
jgi:hypothetical protein